MRYLTPRFSLLGLILAMTYGITIMYLSENQWWLLMIIAVTSGLMFGVDAILCSKQVNAPYESITISTQTERPRIPPASYLN